MKVRQPHPLALAHRSKMWMLPPAKITRRPREALQQALQLALIPHKFHRRSAPASLLVQFRHGLESVRLLHRNPQRNPPQHLARIHSSGRGSFPLVHVQPKSVAQMTNHLVRGHSSPQALAAWPHVLQPTPDFLFVLRVPQVFHGKKFYTTTTIFRVAVQTSSAATAPKPRTTPPAIAARLLWLNELCALPSVPSVFSLLFSPGSGTAPCFKSRRPLCPPIEPLPRTGPALAPCPSCCPPGQPFKIKHIASYWSALAIARTSPNPYNLSHPERVCFFQVHCI